MDFFANKVEISSNSKISQVNLSTEPISRSDNSFSHINPRKSFRKRKNIIVPHSLSNYSRSFQSSDLTLNSSDHMRENILAFMQDYSKQVIPNGLLHPDSKFMNVWNIVVAVLLMYTATIMPFSMAFIQSESKDIWYILDLVIDVLFFIDLVVNCITCYNNDQGVLIVSRSKIFTRYLKTWFFLDLVACFPFSMLETGDETAPDDDYSNFLRLIRLPRIYRLFRISRIIKMFKHYQNSMVLQTIQDFLSLNHSAMRMLGTLLSIVIVIHIGGCFWFLSAKIEGFHPDTWVFRYNYIDSDIGTQYITSIYWTITTMATVGYGDISPFTILEKLFAMIWMIIGLYFFSYTIGTLSNMLSHIDTK